MQKRTEGNIKVKEVKVVTAQQQWGQQPHIARFFKQMGPLRTYLSYGHMTHRELELKGKLMIGKVALIKGLHQKEQRVSYIARWLFLFICLTKEVIIIPFKIIYPAQRKSRQCHSSNQHPNA